MAGTASTQNRGTLVVRQGGEESAPATIINGVTALGCGAQYRRLLAVRRTSIVPLATLSSPPLPRWLPSLSLTLPSHHLLLVTHSLPLRRCRYRHPVLCLAFLRRFYPMDELLQKEAFTRRRNYSTERITDIARSIFDLPFLRNLTSKLSHIFITDSYLHNFFFPSSYFSQATN